MLRSEPNRFQDLQAALNYACSKLTVPLRRWVENSELLRRALFQRKITEFAP
jgi:hypothetical protein